MHKLPTIVFKTLALSLLFMFLLDTSLIVIDTINVHSRVINLAGMMQNEVARNNCMPDALRIMFETQLGDIVEASRVAVKNTGLVHNMEVDRPYGGKTIRGLSESNPLQYGDIADLYISIEMNPAMVYFNVRNNVNKEQTGSLLGRKVFNYKLNYVYSVPCLRYLK